MDMATLNTRVGWAAATNSSISWFRDNSKAAYRTYGLENMAGYYWYQSNISGWGWSVWNCGAVVHTSWMAACATNCRYSLGSIAGPNCCQDSNPMSNCNCNCVNNCGNCWAATCGGVINLNWTNGQCDQCMQCDISGNCDSRAWMQPNCNCLQCNCACNCFAAGQCAVACDCACNCADCNC